MLMTKKDSDKSKKIIQILLYSLSTIILFLVLGFFSWFLLPGPQVVGSNEIFIEKNISFNAPFRIIFSSKMNQKSVERNLLIIEKKSSSKLKGHISWQDRKNLLFYPQKDLPIGVKFELTIRQGATDWLGKKLTEKFVQNYIVVGPPRITMISPISSMEWSKISDQSFDLEKKEEGFPTLLPGQKITVMFDLPIVALQKENILDQFVQFNPPLEGEFNFLGTSSFEFSPHENLPMSETISIKILADFPANDGGKIGQEISWHIQTPSPRIIKTTPSHSDQYIDPQKEIEIEWNQEVDLESLFKKLKITPDLPKEQRREIKITHKEDNKKITKIAFKPFFAKGQRININFAKGIKSKNGKMSSSNDYNFYFTTLDNFKIEDFWPAKGEEIHPGDDLQISFSTPLENEKIKDVLFFEPSIDKKLISISNDWRRNIKGKIVKRITVDLPANSEIKWGIKKSFQDSYEQKLSNDFKSNFKTKNFKPDLSLMSKGGKGMLYDIDEMVSVFIRSVNLKEVDFMLCKVEEKDINFYLWNFKCPAEKVISWKEKLAFKENKYSVTEVPLSERVDLTAGVWFMQFSAADFTNQWSNGPAQFRQKLFLVNANLTAKKSDKEILFHASDFQNGKSINNMKIRLISEGKEITSFKTDQDGLFTYKKNDQSSSYFPFIAIGEKDNLKTFVAHNWDDGISIWDFDLQKDYRSHPYILGYLYTDRPIYRPSQEVNFKGILRSDNAGALSIPLSKEVDVKIESPTGKNLLEQKIAISENGTFSGQFNLAAEAELGQYFISAKINDNWINRSFWIEEYRKPDFKIDIISDQETFYNKDNFEITASLSRYFGASMPEAKVKWHVSGDDFYFSKVDGWWSFSEERNHWWYFDRQLDQKLIQSGETITDQNGEAKINFPINLDKKSPQLFTVTITGTDKTKRSVSKNKTFEVYPANFLVGIRNEDYYLDESSEKITFHLITVLPNGEAAKNKKVMVKLYQSKWNSIQKKGPDGNFFWESNEELIPLQEKEITTGSSGKAVIDFPIDRQNPSWKGSLKAVATIEDPKGRLHNSAIYAYLSSSRWVSYYRSNNDRIEIIADKNSYKVGDNAKIIVKSPFAEPVNALVTIERKEIIDKFVTKISSGKALDIPITKEMMPNSFVSVFLIKGKGLLGKKNQLKKIKQELINIEKKINQFKEKRDNFSLEIDTLEEEIDNVSQEDIVRDLKITKAKLRTAEKDLDFQEKLKKDLQNQKKEIEELIVKNKNEDDQELEEELKNEDVIFQEDKDAEVQDVTDQDNIADQDDATNQDDLIDQDFELSAEDIARPEMKMGIGQIFIDTESKKINLNIITNKENYLPGENVDIEIMAFDENKKPLKNVEISVAVVDQSVLALKARQIKDIVKFFWGKRNLGISTVASLVYFTERLNVKAQKGEKGGGGGGNNQSISELARKKRGEFKDTAWWISSIFTDEQGIAKTNFFLPSNLTTWQIWAVASNKDSCFGSSFKNFITKKKVIIQPSLPRFAVDGDSFDSSVLVHNQTDKNLQFNINLKAENFILDDKSQARQKYFIDASSSKLVNFSGKIVSVLENKNKLLDAKFIFTAENKAENLIDQVEISIPVNSPSIGESMATSGKIDDLKTEFVSIPKIALKNIGQLVINLSALKTGNFTDGMQELIDYPYGCAEQTMSRHFPNVAIKKLEETLGKEIFSIKNQSIQSMIEQGLQKLYSFQRSDGGFGFWENSDKSYPELSAYIFFGLLQTKQAGFTVDESVLSRASSYLLRIINADDYRKDGHNSYRETTNQAFALFALSENEVNNLALANNIFEIRDKLSLFEKAALMMTFQNYAQANLTDSQEKEEILSNEIIASLKQTDRGAQVEEYINSSWPLDSNIRTSAMILFALSRHDGELPVLSKIVDFLQFSRGSYSWGGPWGNTQNTAWVVLAFIEYLKNSQKISDLNIKIHLNNQFLAEEDWNEDELFKVKKITQDLEGLRLDGQKNELNFAKQGKGDLFYDLETHYFIPIDKVKEKNNGVGVFRQVFAFNDKEMKTPLSKIKKGQLMRVKVNVLISERRNFLVVDIPLPSGTEAVNFALETEDQSLSKESYSKRTSCDGKGCDDFHPLDYRWWYNLYYFNHREFRDDRVLLFADYLPKGKYEYYFLMRATTIGNFQFLPAIASEMYRSEIFGRTNGEWFEVVE